MKEQLVQATKESISQIRNSRYFRTERGYQAEFYCHLRELLTTEKIIMGDRILEMEFQKGESIHDSRQRPDIILHVPREASGKKPDKNNSCVWALKLNGGMGDAESDFRKLDEMLGEFKYSFGFWINIDSGETFLDKYQGDYRNKISSIAVMLDNEMPKAKLAYFSNGQKTITEEDF